MTTVTIQISVTNEDKPTKEQPKGRSMVGSRGTLINTWDLFMTHYTNSLELSDPKLIARLFGYRRED